MPRRQPRIVGDDNIARCQPVGEQRGQRLAGGGSIAWMDPLGLLKVGPRSAGSSPGPACYGRGGTAPTVTDADVLLGLLDADNFLGGDMRLDRPAAQAAMARLGDQLGTGVAETASGIYRIVAETMAAAARTHATDRGVDYRGLPLLAFGGAGPVHACAVGALLQSTSVVFPPQASVLSAFGTLVTPVRLDLVRSALGRLDALAWDDVVRLLDEMEAEAVAALEASGVRRGAMRLSTGADLRYVGQQNEVTVPFQADPRAARDTTGIAAAFEAAYIAQYGVAPSHVPAEIVSWRLTAQGPANAETDAAILPTGAPVSASRQRRVALWPDAGLVDVWQRSALPAGQTIDGPAIVEERETTIVLPPDWRAEIDSLGCIVATRKV
jgi:N-methylhydantoinase A